jgi:hypothetical protein
MLVRSGRAGRGLGGYTTRGDEEYENDGKETAEKRAQKVHGNLTQGWPECRAYTGRYVIRSIN